MSPTILTITLLVPGYLLGSLPFSYLVARLYGVDLRQVGSGNIGAANVWRSCGFGAFVLALTADMLKGMLPTLAALHVSHLPPAAVILVGLSAILGHTFPLFLGFRGGKAVATSAGVLLAIAPLLIIAGLISWVIAFLITRISSVGSLSAALIECVAGTALYVSGRLDLAYILYIWVAVGLIIYLHRGNIQRLLAGTERRFKRLS